MQCRKCSAWEINGRDLFCSWCGRKVFEFGLRQTPVRLYLAKGKAPQTRSAQIVENQSPIPVTIECVERPPWLQISPVKTEVAPGGQFRVTLGVDLQKLGGAAFKREPVVFRPAAARGDGHGDFESLRVTVEMWPEPQVTCRELTVYTGKQPIRARLRVATDAPLTVVGIRFKPPYLASDGDLPMELKMIGEAEIPVVLNLPPEAEFKKELVTCHLDVDGLAQPLAAQFELVIKKSAVLHCPELEVENFSMRLMSGTSDEVRLTVHNRGEEVLRVEDVRAEPTGRAPELELKPEPRAFAVEPGKSAAIRLKVSASAEAKSASHFVRITFRSNDPMSEHAAGNLNVKVSNEPYAGFIALDFGTTDSAVAVLKDDGFGALNLALEEGFEDPKIYSNIVFMNYRGDEAEPPYEWEIGRGAKGLGSTTTKLHLFFEAVKTKVGRNHVETLTFTNLGVERRVPAEEIVKFILRDLLERTRRALGRSPARFILSVPTRFTLRQKKILKETFGEAARSLRLDVTVKTIDESLAAGLFYIVNRGPRDELVRGKGSYNMMLLDFGGGTTDVTVFTVRTPSGAGAAGTRGIEVETIGAWGDAELGGEEITKRIARMLAEKFLGRKVSDASDELVVRRLGDKAEAAKLAFSALLSLPSENGQINLGAAPEEVRRKLGESLTALGGGKEKYDEEGLGKFLQEYQANDRSLKVLSDMFRLQSVQLGESEVTEIYERKLTKVKEDLRRLLEMIGRRSGGAPPKLDILLLAGQSSQFPTVSRLLSDLADNMDFVRDADGGQVLKECVSRGALYYSGSGRMGLKITGEKRMWSRLGIKPPTGNFIELIPWGRDYPLETDPFPLYEDEVDGDTLVLSLFENLSLDDGKGRKTERLKEFALQLAGDPREEYRCKLRVDDEGEVTAFCEVDGDWVEMEERR